MGKHGGRRDGAGRKASIAHARKLTVMLPSISVKRLERIASRNGETLSKVIRRAIDFFFEEHRK